GASRADRVHDRRARRDGCRRRDRRGDHHRTASGKLEPRDGRRGAPLMNVCVLGSGSWGTALAAHLAQAGHAVQLWGRNPALIDDLQRTGVNTVYLPEVPLPPTVQPTSSLEQALARADFVVAAVPSHGVRAVIREASPFVPRQALIVSAIKGL